jgi:predicted phosphodiesterase
VKYSPEQDALILHMKENGAFFHQIAEALGPDFTADAVRGRHRILKRTSKPCGCGDGTYCRQCVGPALPIQPIVVSPEIPLNVGPPISLTGSLTSIHYSDVHYPFESKSALSILYQITEDLNPDFVFCHGDLLDCTSISRFEKDPKHRISLQDEVEMAAKHLATMAKLSPRAQRVMIEGNHEDRVRRMIWEMATDPRMGELMRLPGVMDAMELKTLLGMPSNGWEYSAKKVVFRGKLILKHGNVVRKWSGMTAKAEWEKYAKSGMSGHTHRASAFFHKDWNGQHGWYELGCMCELEPQYVEDPDWQNSFCVVTWDGDRYAVEQVFIHAKSAIFRGRTYKA